MIRLSSIGAAVAVVGLLVPTGAAAKGPIEASLHGPGLEAPVRFAWTYEGPGDDARRAPIEHLALATGFFTAVFADASVERFEAATRRLRAAQPRGDLGPRYTLTYRLERPGGGDEIVQDVYPFAEPRPVTHLSRDELVNTPGSWFVAEERLRDALLEAGLPPPPAGGGVGPVWAAAAVLLAGAAAAVLGTRRLGTVYHRSMSEHRRLPMKRLFPTLLAVALALAVLPSAALAKGPIEASITGPGLDSPITIGDRKNWGEEEAMASWQPIMQFAEAAGFFPATFGQSPDPMLERRPAGNLGPRYVVEYRVPGPDDTEDLILQDLYPYAKPAAVTYMKTGQTLFGTQATRGGWFAGTPHVRPLREMLVAAGLPRTPPTADDGSSVAWAVLAPLAALGVAVAIGGLAVVAVRRRPRPAT